ncbi:MAG: dolichyl-phosphate mannose synthase [Pirellulaceae bacterium]|nr:MAG: dolichyl-phosphate mannose synthase [Pirellulaceae bacterium]
MRWLAALPVYNEEKYIDSVLGEVCKYADDVLVVNDGSTDATAQRLAQWPQVKTVSHETNLGYGAALKSAFQYAIDGGYDCLVTLDCDGQHQPSMIPQFVEACAEADVVSGSRYLRPFPGDSQPPEDRMRINRQITELLNRLFGLGITDAFCGFKAYRVEALRQLDIHETGYAMPLEVWVQVAALGLRVIEIAVPLLYLDLSRSFGGSLDDAERRWQHYNEVLGRSIDRMRARGYHLPPLASSSPNS